MERKLFNKSDIFKYIDDIDLDEKLKHLAKKAELKADQDKIEKLQTYESGLQLVEVLFQ